MASMNPRGAWATLAVVAARRSETCIAVSMHGILPSATMFVADAHTHCRCKGVEAQIVISFICNGAAPTPVPSCAYSPIAISTQKREPGRADR